MSDRDESSPAAKRLAEMTQDELLALDTKFKENSDFVSPLELDILYLWRRAKIREFERRATNRGPDDPDKVA